MGPTTSSAPPPPSPCSPLEALPCLVHKAIRSYLDPLPRNEISQATKGLREIYLGLVTQMRLNLLYDPDNTTTQLPSPGEVSERIAAMGTRVQRIELKLNFIFGMHFSTLTLPLTQRVCPNLLHLKIQTVKGRQGLGDLTGALSSLPLLKSLAVLPLTVAGKSPSTGDPGLPLFLKALAEGACPRLRVLELAEVLAKGEYGRLVDALETRQANRHVQCRGLAEVPSDLAVYGDAVAFRRFLHLYLPKHLKKIDLNKDVALYWPKRNFLQLTKFFRTDVKKRHPPKALKHLQLSFNKADARPPGFMLPGQETRWALKSVNRVPGLTYLDLSGLLISDNYLSDNNYLRYFDGLSSLQELRIDSVGKISDRDLQDLAKGITKTVKPHLHTVAFTARTRTSARDLQHALACLLGAHGNLPKLRRLEVKCFNNKDVLVDNVLFGIERAWILHKNDACLQQLEDIDIEWEGVTDEGMDAFGLVLKAGRLPLLKAMSIIGPKVSYSGVLALCNAIEAGAGKKVETLTFQNMIKLELENVGDLLEDGLLPNLINIHVLDGDGECLQRYIAKSQRKGLRKRSVKVNDFLVDGQNLGNHPWEGADSDYDI